MELNLCSGRFCVAFPNIFPVKSSFSTINFCVKKRDFFSSVPLLLKQELFHPTYVLQERLLFVNSLSATIN